MKHKDVIAYFKSLSSEDQQSLANAIVTAVAEEEQSIEKVRRLQIEKSGLKCPSCQSDKVVGYGNYSTGKRYKCKSCGKTFSSLTGTMAHWIHKKELLKEYVYLMLQGYSLRKIAERLDICLKTSFDWRHKILNSLDSSPMNKLTGVIEADETFFLYSEKGNKSVNGRKPRKRGGKARNKGVNKDHVAVLTAFERKSGSFINNVVCRGRITKKAIENGLGQNIDKLNSILCVDSHKSFEGFALDNDINIKRTFVRRKEFVVEKIYHIQHVNNIHGTLKHWMHRFKGVSTKYLQNYLNYFNLVSKLGKSIDQTEKALGILLSPNNRYVQRNYINQHICIT